MSAAQKSVAATDAQHWLSFHLDGQIYAAPLALVGEVVRVGELTSVPGAASDLLGVRHLRGQIVPVLDGRRRLGLPPRDAPSESERIVMLSLDGQCIGLRVDAVGDLLHVADANIAAPPPGRAVRADDPVQGVLPWHGRFVALLDAHRLCRLTNGQH